MRLTGNTVLITGATSGIGLGLARRFHSAGNRVIVAGRREHLLDAIVAEHPGMASVVLDVTDADSVRRAHQAVAAAHPDLNVLVNNAGMMLPEDLTDPEHLATAERTVQTNLLGPVRVSSRFLPSLVGRPDAVIINVTSGRAFVPLPSTPTYSATKAALHAYTEALRVQLADRGVAVLELIPPRVRTALMNQLDSPDAMPLDVFLDEVWDILRTRPDATEIYPESVRFLRFAEADGRYSQALGMTRGVH